MKKNVMLIGCTLLIGCSTFRPSLDQGRQREFEEVERHLSQYEFNEALEILSSSRFDKYDFVSKNIAEPVKDYEKIKLLGIITIFKEYSEKCGSIQAKLFFEQKKTLSCLKSSISDTWLPKEAPTISEKLAAVSTSGKKVFPFVFMQNVPVYRHWWGRYLRKSIESLESRVASTIESERRNNLRGNKQFQKCRLIKDVQFLQSQINGAKNQHSYYEKQGKIKGFYTNGDLQQMGYRKQFIYEASENLKVKSKGLSALTSVKVDANTCEKWNEFY
ncbi:MAG: hypothetical protein COW00_13645 [Bdellovibrio sp. CG12_big_fil_rev_8_21_14_0_65_39_13]|nr:MAG: hypothetical protein COW78_07070 [Bdellovibrio sp. CG22_combo_CG10-13_8_21_14_all_39_27]PIQ58659.1 MAG: hypothetical protein COW00_13645 [Bdellovibrio sp. CG12_big_fil_rev_8_21_14_0_65_39_13]PIR33034.1 MAG: hypothetical protein COV37_18240 [Bdellovibrio sp. CG11_big_fil_rev_8_21_14_0_20_39_38]